MKKLLMIGAALAVSMIAVAPAQDSQEPAQEQQQPEQGDATQQETPAAEPLPRVIGQTRSPEEFDAWRAIDQAATLEQKVPLAREFLETYPDSGLTPFAHDILARHYYQQNDIDNFVAHAEKSLAEVPDNLALVSPLAFIYAEQNKTDEAQEKAQHVLAMIDRLEAPEGVSMADWVMEIEKSKADAYYALGKSHINRFTENPESADGAENVNLKQGIENLEKAIGADPGHDYAYFRLAYSYAQLNNAHKALQYYARAAALGTPVAPIAKEQAEKVHEFIEQTQSESETAQKTVEQVVEEQAAEVQQAVQARQQELQQKIQQLEQQRRQQQGQPEPQVEPQPQP
ncbi:MAG: hypothetical protein ACRD1R_19165 [Acidobacteriota bacterium]